MPQSLAQIYVHLVFSTKDRRPLIANAQMEPLRGYIAGVCRNIDSPLLSAGMVADHVHLLYAQSKNITIADAVAKIKSNSSRWMNQQDNSNGSFQWQRGYAAFSVSASRVRAVERYLENQSEHHKVVSFQDESRQFFKRYKVEYDEKYVWD